MTEEEKAAAVQTKGAYKMLGGAAVSILVTPFMFIYSALTTTASMAAFIAGGVLIGTSFATKAIDNANKEGSFTKSFANQASKYLGEYGAKLIIAGVAIHYPLYVGFTLMVEGAGNILTGKDSMGIIPSADWVSKEIGKAIQGKSKTVEQEAVIVVEAPVKKEVASPKIEKEVVVSVDKKVKESPTKRKSMVERVTDAITFTSKERH